ncbi:MAG TPA: antibiotic biosynthesis monooxygenase [Pseudacidobacterium sp.]|jgi:heme-degrading monooxygenase HmoA|nr:antibiotic biosynthesis monooxygenase [Pseudacidobacterium sp.]
MILEVAVLDVRPTQEDAFEAAMRHALPLIKATPGFLEMHLRQCIERPNRYLLTVSWSTLEDHTVGFRQSDRYAAWRSLLHHFYDPFPIVEHYAEPLSLELPHSSQKKA